MLRACKAVALHRKSEVGRTEPLIIDVESEDGDIFEVYLKISKGADLGVESLANEYLGAILAADLELPVCEPVFVEITDDFINSIHIKDLRDRLLQSSRIGFGSRFAGTQWSRWNEAILNRGFCIDDLLGAFAFDAFIGNPDRLVTNPNVLVKGSEIRLIDHEACFSFRTKIFPPVRPWQLGNLSILTEKGGKAEHAFAKLLTQKKGLNFSVIKSKWTSLTGVRFDEYEACLPEQWRECTEHFHNSVTQMGIVIDRIDECLVEIERVLS